MFSIRFSSTGRNGPLSARGFDHPDTSPLYGVFAPGCLPVHDRSASQYFPETDDPVVVATVENIESVGVIASAMIGAALGNKNTYLVERGTTCNVLPGSVIFSATAFMNGNVIDLAVPFQNKTRILR